METGEKLIVLAVVGGLGLWAYSSIARQPPPVENALPPTGTQPGAVVPSPGSANAPRGIRNNNPGNIKWTKENNWKGQTGRDSGGFAVFSSSSYGLRAMAKLLRVYITKYGLNTPLKITMRWSPDAVGLSGAYAAGVAKFVGLPANQVISASDTATLAKLMRGMIAQENGGASYVNAYSPAAISAALTEP